MYCYCNGCENLEKEEWRGDMTAFICTGTDRAPKYVLNSPVKKEFEEIIKIYRPAWCREKKI